MKTIGWAASLAVLVMGVGCVNRDAQKQAKETEALLADKVMPVQVVTAELSKLEQTLEVTGSVSTSDDVSVGSKVPGKILAVFVREGDSIGAGQPIAQIDTTTYRLALRQAEAQLTSAKATLNQALANAKVGPSRSSAALAAAEAQLRSAKAQLDKAMKGARPEEKAQAANNVEAARSTMETAKREMERRRQLYGDGAISKQALEAAENAYTGALNQYENALQAQRIAQSAVRSEDLESAREAVRQAEEGVRTATANKRLDVLLEQQAESARAAVRAAQAQVDMAKESISDCTVRAPLSGKVSGKPMQPGTVVGAGTPVARLIGSGGSYFDGEVPESSLSLIRQGQPVRVVFESLSGITVEGHIAAINPTVSTVGRLATVRVEIPDGMFGIKPGMFARGAILVRTLPSVIVLPYTAVVQRGNDKVVFVVDGDKAKSVKVTTGLTQGTNIQVSGVSVGEKVVVAGQSGIDDGTPVRIEEN